MTFEAALGPSVSAVLPAYNEEAIIERTVRHVAGVLSGLAHDYEVIVTNNLFGDIVTDLGAALQGGLGMAASANVHYADPRSRPAMFEPVHGSAPPLVGKDLANPIASFLTVGMMLSHLGYPDEERRIENVCAEAVTTGNCTADVGGKKGTRDVADWVLARLRAS